MRITLVVPRYLPHLGGIENHVHALAGNLQALGHEVTVGTQVESDASLPPSELDAAGVQVLRFPSFGRVRGQGVSPRLWKWIRQGAQSADIIHVHNYHALTSLPALAVAKAPVVLTPHYLGPGDGLKESLIHRTYGLPMGVVLRRVSAMIFVTRSEAEKFHADIGFEGLVDVIPNGVDSRAIAEANPYPMGGRLLVVAGRFEEYKQPHLVLEALAYLPEEYKLALVGAGRMDAQLRDMAERLGLKHRVLFAGRLDPSAVYAWYKSADVVISMSRRECFGMTLAEGLAAGAAVVASDIGAHRDVVEGTSELDGRLVPARTSARELADVISALPPRGVRGPTRFPLASWSEVAMRTDSVYRRIA